MEELGYTLFETALGVLAVAWSKRGIVALELPSVDPTDTSYRLRANAENAYRKEPPAWVSEVIVLIQKHLGGDLQNFLDVPLDLEHKTEFYRAVYKLAVEIPPGKTRTYGELAKSLGKPNAARAVGQALANNPILLLVPCHRVLGSTGAATGFSAPGGIETKKKLLLLEGALKATQLELTA